MKRKEKAVAKDSPAGLQSQKESPRKGPWEEPDKSEEQSLFLLENGKLQPFNFGDYTASILYQMVESFSVECKLVRPEDPMNLIYEGRKPSKKTVPILMTKNDDCLLLDSWDVLESEPEQLANANEVIGAIPVKQVFVLKRK